MHNYTVIDWGDNVIDSKEGLPRYTVVSNKSVLIKEHIHKVKVVAGFRDMKTAGAYADKLNEVEQKRKRHDLSKM